jgi:SOS-response transcriptional repressor LexA
MSKRIALCIASRGNPRLLFETLHAVLRQCTLPATKAVIGLDEDDPTLADALTLIEALENRRIIVSTAPRAPKIRAVKHR